MKKIGIELNGIIRDINSQILKYYKKDINKSFNTEVNMNLNDFISQLPFKTKKDMRNFLFIDYPYEIYGCAKEMTPNLLVYLNQWAEKLNKLYEEEEYVICFFSLDEEALTIQSTYFFLSKTGSRIRFFLLPEKGKENEVWDNFDIVITTNKEVISSKPDEKTAILIKKDDYEYDMKMDYSYTDLISLINDEELIKEINENHSTIKEGNLSILGRLVKKIREKINI